VWLNPLIFIKYLFEKKIFIKSPYHKKKKKKKKTQKKITYPNPLKKASFGKGWNYPILPSSPKKNPFGKEKRIATLCALFLKLHFQLVILSI
jgi:hypothetical protein